MSQAATNGHAEQAVMGGLFEISIDKLIPSEDNREIGDVTQLAKSIGKLGLLHPPNVAPMEDGNYRITIGHRRVEACKVLGYTTVVCLVRDDFAEDLERRKAMIVENFHRADPTYVEQAIAIQRLADEHKMTQSAIAEELGMTQETVSRRLALMKLPADILKKVADGEIRPTDGVELARLHADPARIKKALQYAASYPAKTYDDPIAYCVKEQLATIATEKKIQKRIKDWSESGVPIVDEERGGMGSLRKHKQRPLRGTGLGTGLRTSADAWHAVTLEPELHATEACHAAVVNEQPDDEITDVYLVCTDVTRHLPKGDSELKLSEDDLRKIEAGDTPTLDDHGRDLEKERQAEAERDEQLENHAARRKDFVRDLIKSEKLTDKDVTEALVNSFLAERIPWLDDYDELVGLAELCGIDTPADDDKDPDDFDPVPQLKQLVANGAGTAVAMAIVARGNERMTNYRQEEVAENQRWFDFLAAQGYKIHELETEEYLTVLKDDDDEFDGRDVEATADPTMAGVGAE